MRRSTFALLFLVASLFVPAPSSACWKCTMKLRCYGQECWTEYVCITNLVYNQRGFAECRETIGGCVEEGGICRWVAVPDEENVPLFLRRDEPQHSGPLLCASRS